MSVTVHIPTPLRRFTGERSEVEVGGRNVGEALGELVRDYPALGRQLYSEEGELRGFILVFLNDENIRDLEDGATPLRSGDLLSLIPSIAGG